MYMKPLFKRSLYIGSSIIALSTGGYYFYKKSFVLNKPSIELNPDFFVKYKINWRHDIDKDHYLLELKPLIPQKKNIWKDMGYNKLWSVEVKQPEISVVRNYTPLPLVHSKNAVVKDEDTNIVDVLKDGCNADGILMFYIKQYSNGEVARWLHNLPQGHVIELRGPFLEYEFPEYPKDEIIRDRSFLWNGAPEKSEKERFKYQPFDICMFTGGTGIVACLQLVLTENPFRGRIKLFHGCHDRKELGPLYPLMKKLDKHDRIDLNLYENFSSNLKSIFKLIPKPYGYEGQRVFQVDGNNDPKQIIRPVLSLVVGPEGFITSVAGTKLTPYQGPISGLLGAKGWSNDNVYKLS